MGVVPEGGSSILKIYLRELLQYASINAINMLHRPEKFAANGTISFIYYTSIFFSPSGYLYL